MPSTTPTPKPKTIQPIARGRSAVEHHPADHAARDAADAAAQKPRQSPAGELPPAAVGHAAQHVEAQADRRPDRAGRDGNDQEAEQQPDRPGSCFRIGGENERAISETPQPRKAAQAEIIAL